MTTQSSLCQPSPWLKLNVFVSRNKTQDQGPTAHVQNAVTGVQSAASVRRPSATLTFVLIAQVQFLATLSLVDNTGAKDSTLAGFAEKLRCDSCLGQAWNIFPPSLQTGGGAWDPNVFAGGHQMQALSPLCCRELFSLHPWQPRLINRTLFVHFLLEGGSISGLPRVLPRASRRSNPGRKEKTA